MSFEKVSLRRLLGHGLSACIIFVAGVALAGPINSNVELQTAESVTFTLFVTEMTDCDSNSACDLFVKISCASSSSNWQSCGQTSKRQDDNNPVWPEVFTFNHSPGTSQRWKFEIMDADVAFDDLIASFEVNMDAYVNAPGSLYQVPVSGNTGIFWIHRQR